MTVKKPRERLKYQSSMKMKKADNERNKVESLESWSIKWRIWRENISKKYPRKPVV